MFIGEDHSTKISSEQRSTFDNSPWIIEDNLQFNQMSNLNHIWNDNEQFQPQVEESNQQLTIFSSRQSSIESYSQLNLNENDHHAIIQSMLSFIKIPDEQPLNVCFNLI